MRVPEIREYKGSAQKKGKKPTKTINYIKMFYTLQSIIKIVNKKCFYLQAKSSWQKRYFSSLHRKKSGAFFPRMPCSPWRRSAAKIPAFTYKHIRLSSKQSPWRPAGRRRPPSRTACRSTQRQQKKESQTEEKRVLEAERATRRETEASEGKSQDVGSGNQCYL